MVSLMTHVTFEHILEAHCYFCPKNIFGIGCTFENINYIYIFAHLPYKKFKSTKVKDYNVHTYIIIAASKGMYNSKRREREILNVLA